jgi:hypothetical protein
MFPRPTFCPNPECAFHDRAPADFLRKRGTYIDPKGRRFQRYECKECGRTFTNNTFKPKSPHRKTDITRPLIGLLCSGVTNRRAALLLDISRATVARRIVWLAGVCRDLHAEAIRKGKLDTSRAQFDEMQTSLLSKTRPLTIALVVREKTGEILSAKVGRIPTSGKISKQGKAIGWTKDDGPQTREAALTEAKPCIKATPAKRRGRPILDRSGKTVMNPPVITSDSKKGYVVEIGNCLGPKVRIAMTLSRGNPGNKRSHDTMFALNHVCAKIRADIAVMARDTWATTKKIGSLQDRLDIYIAWHNKYEYFGERGVIAR